MTDKLNILIIIDEWGWAFDFEGRGLAKYSKHNILVKRYSDITSKQYTEADIILCMHPSLLNCTLGREKKKIIVSIRCNVKEQSLSQLFNDKLYTFDAIACINCESYDAIKQDIELSSKSSYLVYSGVDHELFKRKSEPKNSNLFIIGWAGNSTRKCKRFNLLSQLGFPLIIKADWGSEFFIKDRSQQSMIDFYHEIDVYVCLSWSEGLGQTILEAMACGLPVVSTRIGVIDKMIDPEWIINSTDEKVIVKEAKEKLQRLKDDPELRKKVGEKNRQLIIDKWSWERIAKIYDEMFEEVYAK